METCPNCSCEQSTPVASRREVLAAMTVAAIAVPVLAQTARAETSTTSPSEGGGKWIKTVKAADLKDKTAKAIMTPANVTSTIITRDGTTVMALSPKCTHKGCSVKPAVGKAELACPCHRAEFDFTGKNTAGPHKPTDASAPATLPALVRYALRLNADGVIEVDTSKPLDADDKAGVLTLPA